MLLLEIWNQLLNLDYTINTKNLDEIGEVDMMRLFYRGTTYA